MRIGLLADVHGNIHGLNACFDELARAKVDKLFCAGDVIGYYPFVNEVIDALKGKDVVTIKGNHEAYFLGEIPVTQERYQQYSLDWVEKNISVENREFIAQLPESHQIVIDGLKLIMFHGSPWSLEDYVYPNYEFFDRFLGFDADFIVLGQTHIPMLRRVGSVTIVNPGSCGQPRDYNPLASCAVLDTETGEVDFRRTVYDVEAVCEKVREEGLWPSLATILKRTKSVTEDKDSS